jgi:hypothetical protein
LEPSRGTMIVGVANKVSFQCRLCPASIIRDAPA